MEVAKSGLAQWLEEKCREEHLSLREAGKRAGVSHSTIRAIMQGGRASAISVTKLAEAFSGSGDNQRLILEDELLVMAGYRTPRPEGEEINQPLAQLMDEVSGFSRSQLKVMLSFAEFLSETTVKAGQKRVKKE